MERWILAVGYDKTTTQAAQQEWIKHGIYVVAVADMEAAKALLPRKGFILGAIFSSDPPPEQTAELRKIKPVNGLIVSDEAPDLIHIYSRRRATQCRSRRAPYH